MDFPVSPLRCLLYVEVNVYHDLKWDEKPHNMNLKIAYITFYPRTSTWEISVHQLAKRVYSGWQAFWTNLKLMVFGPILVGKFGWTFWFLLKTPNTFLPTFCRGRLQEPWWSGDTRQSALCHAFYGFLRVFGMWPWEKAWGCEKVVQDLFVMNNSGNEGNASVPDPPAGQNTTSFERWRKRAWRAAGFGLSDDEQLESMTRSCEKQRDYLMSYSAYNAPKFHSNRRFQCTN